MSTNGGETVVVIGVFPTRGQAEGAIDELWHAGYRHDQVGIASPGEPGREATTTTERMENIAAEGATDGAVAGGVLGAVAGMMAAVVLPGIGPVVAGGILASLVTGAAAGAAGGAFVGPFVAMGLADEDAGHAERELAAGRTLVMVSTATPDEAIVILKSHGGEITDRSGRTPTGWCRRYES